MNAKTIMALAAGVVTLAAIGAGAWYYLKHGEKKPSANSKQAEVKPT
jgi:hypothetical protein